MASAICIKDQFLWVSNLRLCTLVDFAIEVGGQIACSDDERQMVARLRSFREQAFPGINFDLEELFPNIGEKQFWARCFHNVARRIFLRQLGNQEVQFWQSSAIGDAYLVARMLTGAVQEVETGWYPANENSVEAEAFNAGPVRIRT